jgi:hypothetical protein
MLGVQQVALRILRVTGTIWSNAPPNSFVCVCDSVYIYFEFYWCCSTIFLILETSAHALVTQVHLSFDRVTSTSNACEPLAERRVKESSWFNITEPFQDGGQ